MIKKHLWIDLLIVIMLYWWHIAIQREWVCYSSFWGVDLSFNWTM